MAEGEPSSLPGESENDGDHEPSSPNGVHDDKKTEKVTILLKATGNAPILKKRKWVVEPNRTISSVNAFVRKYMKLEPTDSLFFYVNQTFAPSPDETVNNLFDCFGTDGKLVLHYCLSQAWG